MHTHFKWQISADALIGNSDSLNWTHSSELEKVQMSQPKVTRAGFISQSRVQPSDSSVFFDTRA